MRSKYVEESNLSSDDDPPSVVLGVGVDALVLLAHTVRYASAEAGFWRRFDRVFERVAVDTHGVGAFGRAVDDADGAEADADARQGPTLWAALLRPEFLGDLDPECENP